VLVDHFSFSSSGGAGLVAGLLVKGQVALGIDAELHTVTDASLWDSPWRHPALSIRSSIDKYIISSSSDAPMFSLARRGARSISHWPRPDSIIHLHWTEGVFQRRRVVEWLQAGHKVVFTLHDMSPFTGGCHQSLGCKGFEVSCNSCPQSRRIFRPAVESRFVKMPDLSGFREQIAVVAPSAWMRDQAVRSRHFSKLRTSIIENPIHPSFFQDFDRNRIRSDLQIPPGTFVACSIAAQIDNPAKRIKDCLEVFSDACARAATPGVFLLVGSGSETLAKEYPFTISMGSGGPEHVAQALAASDVLLSGSVAESAGMTILEGMAQGVTSIVISNGGSDQILTDARVGHLVADFEEMKSSIIRLMISAAKLPNIELSQNVTRFAADKAGLENVSLKYTALYRELESTGMSKK
jgi:glycosyltransferase involved in cell wall biosynthesis